MPRLLRFIAGLVLGLALLTWGGSHIVSRTTRAWFENDIRLRSGLAVSGAHDTLVSRWRSDQRGDLEQVLERMTRDDRIMAAAACGVDLFLEARTLDYPLQLDCGDLGRHVRPAADAPAEAWTSWATIIPVSGGSVHATAIPLLDRGRPLGFVVLVHDLSFIERREATTRRFLWLAFAMLATAASLVTVVAARLSWRGWSNELRRLLKGESRRPEFRPFVRDVRDLVERLASEREVEGLGGLWTPQRLKNALTRYLHGERLVVVANREPYIHERTPDGSIRVVHPASGLVTA